MKNVIRILVTIVMMLSFTYLYSQGKVYVLCYHTFLDKSGVPTDFSVTTFKAQMNKIKNLGFKFVSWKEIESGKVSGNNNVLITIDDGNKTVLKAWNEVLKPMGITPVLFLYPGVLNKAHYAMKYDQVKDLLVQGAELGVHGYYHEYVGQKLYDKNPTDFWREIKTAKSTLEKNIPYTFTLYAYPFGFYDDLTVDSVRKTQYTYAFKLGEVPLTLPLKGGREDFLIPRFLMTKGSWNHVYNLMKADVAKLP